MKTIINLVLDMIIVAIIAGLACYVFTTQTGYREIERETRVGSQFWTVTYQPTNIFGMDVGEEFVLVQVK